MSPTRKSRGLLDNLTRKRGYNGKALRALFDEPNMATESQDLKMQKMKEQLAQAKKEIAETKKELKSAMKGKRTKKDPNAPKKGKTGFFIFAQEKRPYAKASLPDGAPVTEVARMLGNMWKKLSNAEKKPYQNKASIDQQRYKNEMAAYKARMA